jgi:predicted NUDIX family NTP pyrophosphohydrolase
MARGKRSAGLLLFRESGAELEVLLAHPGGPFWFNKDEGSWSIPKGEIAEDEEPLTAARREFREEIGFAPEGEFLPLTPVRQASGKLVYAWAIRGDFDPAQLSSNTFSIEWPSRSGKFKDFPEIDRAGWFNLAAARAKILQAQTPLLDELAERFARGD